MTPSPKMKNRKKKLDQPKLELGPPAYWVMFEAIEPGKKTQWIESKMLYLKDIFCETLPVKAERKLIEPY